LKPSLLHVITFLIAVARFIALSSAAALIADILQRFVAYLGRLIAKPTMAPQGPEANAGSQLRLSGVAERGGAQANTAKCEAESLIGETTAGARVGGDSFTVTGGKVYLTGPYNGAPFGLSIVTPVKAGRFDLGNITSRAKIYIHFFTNQVRLTSKLFPTIIDGIPLQIKHVNVDINRPGFTFNPTT
jgi:hypothetical protein